MNVALYDVDSKIPNLALMKLSAWHRAQGHRTSMYLPIMHATYDKVYASKIFDFSDGSMITPDMVVGGTGVDLTTDLPAEVMAMDPDYGLYGFGHSMGFAMRGCRFRCGFCVVPRKEGKARSNRTIEQLWTNRSSDFLWLLDNDFFGNPNWKECIGEIRELELRVCFLQGLNIRIITEEQAHALASVRFRNKKGDRSIASFAWDRMRDEKLIRRGVKRLEGAGIKPWQMQFFVLIGYDTDMEQDLHRVLLLRDLGADPFVMPFDRSDQYQKSFTRWVNHRAIFNTVTWADYQKSKGLRFGA